VAAAGSGCAWRVFAPLRATLGALGSASGTSCTSSGTWSYPRNWGGFVRNDEERLEYTLSPYLFPCMPGWLRSYHTLLLQLFHLNVCATLGCFTEVVTENCNNGLRPRDTKAVHTLILDQEPWTHGAMLLPARQR
jgi:hypothetical protein